jgi:hypothetical protein
MEDRCLTLMASFTTLLEQSIEYIYSTDIGGSALTRMIGVPTATDFLALRLFSLRKMLVTASTMI